MSREELVSAFLEGRVSRRTLIRRLVAGGVSVGAAVSYAQVLRPVRATAQVGDSLYPLVLVEILSTDLDTVIAEQRLRVKATSTEEINAASFRVFLTRTTGLSPLGERDFFPNFLTGAGSRTLNVNISTATLANRNTAQFWVWLLANDGEGFPGVATIRKSISR